MMALADLNQISDVPVPAVLRATRILDVMSKRKGAVTMTEIALATGLAKSSVSNLLRTLALAGMVRQAQSGWVLGYRVLELGQSVLASTDLISEFRRLAMKLPTLREETVLIAVLDGLDVLYLARHNGNQPVRLATDIGHRLPAVVTSLGKAMLASLPEAELEERLGRVTEMPRLTNHSYRTVDELRGDLAIIRERGYSVDDQQNTAGVTCFGIAIDGFRQPTAVSTTLLSSRATDGLREGLIRDLQKLSRQLAGMAT